MNLRQLAGLSLLSILLVSFPLAAEEPPKTPWTPQYKIKPSETERLTAADVAGPDGIVYPDWRWAGIPGGIPEDLKTPLPLAQFGAAPDDDKDDSVAIEAGVKALADQGGGVLLLGKGTWHLDRPVTIMDHKIVLRGEGSAQTKIVFRYGVPEGQVRFFLPRDGETIGPDHAIEIHAAPEKLDRITLEVDGKPIADRRRSLHWGGTFNLLTSAHSLKPGPHKLKATAEWEGGRRTQATIRVTLDPKHRLPAGRRAMPGQRAALLFLGDGRSGKTWKLAQDGKRGDREVTLTEAPDLKPGDAVELAAPATPRWNALVKNACKWGAYRHYQFRVEQVDGPRVRLNQPLRIEYPLVDGPTLKRFDPVRRCGVENLSIVQTEMLWTSGVLFQDAWECWARNVKVTKAGRHPVYAVHSKWCEIRDSQFDDAWYHGGGGTAYVGWEGSCDCLMENVTTRKMRHAPCVQWASAGNVIRNSTFLGSDAQWHAGWTNENLFENCRIEAAGKDGTYGHGAWGSPPEDEAHGPQGPRNVVYGCEIHAARSGLWMGGMNENWLIVYNRFLVENGPGISAKTCSFDHILRGNVIALANPKYAAIQLASDDCTGIEILDNRILGGSGQLVAGPGKPAVDTGNRFLRLTAKPPAATPPVPSIFQWQRERREE